MDALTGGLIAAGVAWASILLVILAPATPRPPAPHHVRRLGAATIALLALQALGLPLPAWSPVVLFLGGLIMLIVIGPRGHAAAA